jgi:hypothetical protein
MGSGDCCSFKATYGPHHPGIPAIHPARIRPKMLDISINQYNGITPAKEAEMKKLVIFFVAFLVTPTTSQAERGRYDIA